ncbi:hypothetical protein IFM89_007510 [Coptis chinensis]|uniref:Uncharacterized protein n=1 Tax=Coptis chinensis TaxID=261450 RepID=A0A835HDC7_9MAGN|nr:hypothetical protein IFM89_007510 [Coptis chinensis]
MKNVDYEFVYQIVFDITCEVLWFRTNLCFSLKTLLPRRRRTREENLYVVVNGVLLILGIRAMIGLGDHKILLFVNLVLGNPWHQSYINCKLKQFRPRDLWPSAGVPITSSCWSENKAVHSGSLPLWRSAIYCQSSCFIPTLQGTSVISIFHLLDLKNDESAFLFFTPARCVFVCGCLAHLKWKRTSYDFGKIEEEIDITVKNLNEKEELILLKEKEAAKSGCERLRLVSATAMAEISAALELGDLEEANTLLAEAEAADSEAKQLQQAHDLKEEEFENTAKQFISIELIANLGRR